MNKKQKKVCRISSKHQINTKFLERDREKIFFTGSGMEPLLFVDYYIKYFSIKKLPEKSEKLKI